MAGRHPVRDIAATLGRSESSVRSRAKRDGISLSGLSLRRFARELGVHHWALSRLLRRLGIVPSRGLRWIYLTMPQENEVRKAIARRAK